MDFLSINLWPFALMVLLVTIIMGSIFYFGYKKFVLQLSADSRQSVYPLSLLRMRIKILLYVVAWICIAFAVLRPVLPIKTEKVDAFKLDMMIALDISPSMLAKDIEPDRITRAKDEIGSLLNHLPNYRVGLVLFSGEAILQVPLTTDYGSIKTMLSDISPDFISNKGTNFTDAFMQAEQGLKDSDKGFKKMVLLITDGEDHSRNIDSVLQDMKKANILMYTIGIGSQEGAPIPVYDQNGQFVEYKKDRDGHPIVSRLDASLLSRMTAQLGGKLYLVNQSNFNLGQIVTDIIQLEKQKNKINQNIAGYQELYQLPLFAGVLFLILAVAIPHTSVKKARRKGRKTEAKP